ncbi:PH domain-containing protein [Allorhodopirellula solitaria]|uniref:Bacterial membrane flanked domain protein n=1 Tax=Allorhodopirellula solitaria TaxID=2527987 RepID=A0A5C5X1P4_9BACT|nr:PH domain-containing protein [Allorhodopirellula solitaria]TWT56073.1 Bacterial membrane flanked domain protein [Allorhodopirellula solitaria]
MLLAQRTSDFAIGKFAVDVESGTPVAEENRDTHDFLRPVLYSILPYFPMATPTDLEKRPTMSESEPLDPTADDQRRGGPPPGPASNPPPADRAHPLEHESPRDRFEKHVANHRDSHDDHDPEETLWSGGYSPKAMTGWWIVLVVITIALLVACFMFSQLPLTVALGIIVLLWVLVAANYARMRLGYHYELTSQRFIHKTGLLTRRSDRVEVIDIDDVSYEQGPVQRLLGVGSILITSSDRSDPELKLLGIDRVSQVAGLIDDVRRKERRRRSLHIESI